MDVFASATDGSLQHKYFDGDAWQPSPHGWDNLKGLPDGQPSVTSWAPGRLDVFFKNHDDELCLVYYDGSSWGPKDGDYESLDGPITSGPAAVSWGPNRNDVFAIDTNQALTHQYWDGSHWSGWESFDLKVEFIQETPCAVSWGMNRLDVFLINTNGTLSHIYWDGFQFAATASLNRLDIVALGEDGQYYYKYYDGASWQPSTTSWYSKGGQFSSPPSVVSWVKNADQRLDIFGVTTDGNLAHQTWYGTGWYPEFGAWEELGGGLTT